VATSGHSPTFSTFCRMARRVRTWVMPTAMAWRKRERRSSAGLDGLGQRAAGAVGAGDTGRAGRGVEGSWRQQGSTHTHTSAAPTAVG